MQVTPNVRAVQVPDAHPMHPSFTTIYLVGQGQVFTVDSGEDFDRYRWMLKGYLAASERAELMLSGVSHYHADHSANLRWLQEEFGAAVYLLPRTAELLGPRLPERGVSYIADGDQIEVSGSLRLQVLHTPGHSEDSVCYYLEDEGVLFTGDTVLGASTTMITDLTAYMATLNRLQSLPHLKLICPGHGPLIENPQEVLADYVRRRLLREQEILDILSEGGAVTSMDIVERCYQQVDRRLWPAADIVVQTHLRKLQDEDRVRMDAGTPRHRTPEEEDAALQEEREGLDLLQRADQLREAMNRRAVRLQEAGPFLQEWLEAPRFELNR